MPFGSLYQLISHLPAGRCVLPRVRTARPIFHCVGSYRNISQQSEVNGPYHVLLAPPCIGVTYSTDLASAAFLFSQRRGAKVVKPKDVIHFWKIRVGDKVVVISGKDKGKVGEVLACDKLRNQVKVKDCNMRKLLVDGQMVMIEKKIHYSNVQLVDPLLNCGTRVSIRFNRDKEPLRVSKKSGYVIPWPAEKPEPEKEIVDGEKDTAPEVALARTYNYKMDLQSMQRLRQAMQKYNRDL